MNVQLPQRTPHALKDAPMPSPSASASAATSTVLRVWIALTVLIFLAACSSDGASSSTPDPQESAAPATSFQAPDVTTTIAQDDRPTSLSDEVTMFPRSFVENESAVIDFEASYDDGDDAIERIEVALGDAVDFEGWTIHIEAIGSDSVLWWATGPDGEQIGGDPLS